MQTLQTLPSQPLYQRTPIISGFPDIADIAAEKKIGGLLDLELIPCRPSMRIKKISGPNILTRGDRSPVPPFAISGSPLGEGALCVAAEVGGPELSAVGLAEGG